MVGRRGEALGTCPAVVFRGLDQPFRHARSLAATAEKRIDLVDAADKARPRFPADRKPGTFGSRGVERFIFRWDINETLAPARDPAVGIRVGGVVIERVRHALRGEETGGAGRLPRGRDAARPLLRREEVSAR